MSKPEPRFLLNQRCPSHSQGRHEIHRLVELDWDLGTGSESETKSSAAATRTAGLSALAAVFATIAVCLLLTTALFDDIAGWLAFAPLLVFTILLAARSGRVR
jgi:hypothetical protein